MCEQRRSKPTPSEHKEMLPSKVKSLEQQVEALEQQIYRLKLERDVLEATAEIIKKDRGADPKTLINREKAAVIGAL